MRTRTILARFLDNGSKQNADPKKLGCRCYKRGVVGSALTLFQLRQELQLLSRIIIDCEEFTSRTALAIDGEEHALREQRRRLSRITIDGEKQNEEPQHHKDELDLIEKAFIYLQQK